MIKDLTLKGCIEFAITTEEFGSENYSRLAEKFRDIKDIASLFGQLSQDELVHKKQFSELLAQIPGGAVGNLSPEMSDYLKAMSHSVFFSQYHGPFKDVDAIKDRDDALQVALEFEKATLGFYKAVEDTLESSSTLSQVIAAEKNHVIAIMKALLVEGSKFRSLQDNWS